MTYLTFLIDNYKNIPLTGAVFVHGSRWAWHNDAKDYDNLSLLSLLNISSALDTNGYHNLRCDWSASTCPPNTPPQGSLERSMRARIEPWNERAASDAAMPRALALLFGGVGSARDMAAAMLGRSDAVRAQCCAQFVVSRERIWAHSRAEYVGLRQWLLDEDGAPRDDKISGRILSYVWHILFLPPSNEEGEGERVDLDWLNGQACPKAEDCYCRLYGRCGLSGCTDGSCQGQYSVPPGFRLPEDWKGRHL